MTKITIRLILSALLAIFVIQADARTLSEIKKSGEVIIGMRGNRNAPPINYLEAGVRKGIDIDLSNEVARNLGVAVRIEPLGSVDDRISCLLNKECDIVIDSFSVTPERRQKIDFSAKPYLMTGVGLILANSFRDKVKSWRDIGAGTRFPKLRIAMEGEKTTIHSAFVNFYPDFELKIYATGQEAWEAFKRGEADGFSQDYLILQQRADQDYLLDGQLTYDPYGIGINKDYHDVRDAVSEIIDKLEKEGALERIITKYTHQVTKSSSDPVSSANYTVKDGDTISTIAQVQCKHPVKWRAIWEVNKELIPYPDLIRTGQVLKIPDNCANDSTDSTQRKPTRSSRTRHNTRPIPSKQSSLEKRLQKLKDMYDNHLITQEVYEGRAKALFDKYGD
jgi:ABC-type amino acid transport substrate-binding protein